MSKANAQRHINHPTGKTRVGSCVCKQLVKHMFTSAEVQRMEQATNKRRLSIQCSHAFEPICAVSPSSLFSAAKAVKNLCHMHHNRHIGRFMQSRTTSMKEDSCSVRDCVPGRAFSCHNQKHSEAASGRDVHGGSRNAASVPHVK